ncbi:hypothetical protein QBC35DRAFT_529561 [Podospora australis]|uniref:Uncharacterized protein n=1 Tax=Podospora australis TaxID=1536484 RepID=A0AAN7AJG5_9PEZI|nr:hypothetical protein QBC35DRAFT_529561 [Podospora australis]
MDGKVRGLNLFMLLCLNRSRFSPPPSPRLYNASVCTYNAERAPVLFCVIYGCCTPKLRYKTLVKFITAQDGQPAVESVLLTLAATALPEDLSLVGTLASSLATTRILKENNLLHHPNAFETLVNATTIHSDKTKTLTQNKRPTVASILHTIFRVLATAAANMSDNCWQQQYGGTQGHQQWEQQMAMSEDDETQVNYGAPNPYAQYHSGYQQPEAYQQSHYYQQASTYAEPSTSAPVQQVVTEEAKWIRGRGIVNHFAGGPWCPDSGAIMEIAFLTGHPDAIVTYPGALASKLYNANFIHEDTLRDLHLKYFNAGDFPRVVLTHKGPLRPIGRCKLMAKLPEAQSDEWTILDFYVLKGSPTAYDYMFIIGNSGCEQLLGAAFDFQGYNDSVPSRLREFGIGM